MKYGSGGNMDTLERISEEKWNAILRANCLSLERAAATATKHCAECNWPRNPGIIKVLAADGQELPTTNLCATCAAMLQAVSGRAGLVAAHQTWQAEQTRKRAMLRGNPRE